MALPRPTRIGSTSLRELTRLLGAVRVTGTGDPAVTGVSLDSRTVRPGDLYAALPGEHTHGARFAREALAAGAVAVLTDPAGAQLLETSAVPVLVTEDPRAHVGVLASRVYRTDQDAITLIGITGTNGKTTTAHLIESALSALGHTAGLIGTVETRIGAQVLPSTRTTPESTDLHALIAVMTETGVETCVMEVSSHALALHRVDGLVYDLALFTNLSQDHLDFHRDMEDYFAAKASLFTPDRARRGLVCVDDEWGRRLAETSGIPVSTLTTTDRSADWQVDLDPDATGAVSAFRLTGPDGVNLRLRSALPGDFNIVNTAMAVAALVESGVPAAQAGSAVLSHPHVPGRMELVQIDDSSGLLPRVVVDYAHTPDAIRAALHALRPTTPGRLVCVTGAGGDRDPGKRPIMGAAAAAAADVVVVTDDNPRSEDPGIIRDAVLRGALAARPAGRDVTVVEVAGRDAAIRVAVEAALGLPPFETTVGVGPAATVAVVGKGHESGQEVDGQVLPFDDRTECEAALRAGLQRLRKIRSGP